MKKIIIMALMCVVALGGTFMDGGTTLAQECDVNTVAASISAYLVPYTPGDPAYTGPVYPGDVIRYRTVVSTGAVAPGETACCFHLGQLSITLPDGTAVPLAGFNPGVDDFPTVCEGSPAIYWSTIDYTVNPADVDPDGYVRAYIDYGQTVHAPGQAYGIFLSDPEEPTASASSSRANPLISPDIDIEKTVDFDGDGVYTDYEINSAGETASWRIVVCNTGDTTVYNIVVTDTNGHNFGVPFDLNPGNCTTFTYDMAMYMDTVNTACAEGMDAAGALVGPVCDPAQVSILSHHVPTLSQWGMIGMAILFAALLIWSIRRRWLVSASRR